MTHYKENSIGTGAIAFLGGMVAWALLGPKIKSWLNNNETWNQMKTEVLDQARNVKDMTKEQYEKLIDETSDKYRKVKRIGDNELQDLKSDLLKHWDKIKIAWQE